MHVDTTARPRVLVTYEWRLPRTAMTQYLAHLRPDLAFVEVLPSELPEALAGSPGAVVVCDAPTPEIEAHAKGWLVVPFDGPHDAVAGVGERSHSFPLGAPEDILGALDDLVAGRWAETGDVA